jgi:lysozyme
MEPTPFCAELVRVFEGLRLTRYSDAAGKPTIGYGHLILFDESFPSPITEERAEEMLVADLKIACAGATRGLPYLANWQADALTSFAFNLGVERLRTSTMFDYLLRGEILNAAHEFRLWKHAGGRSLSGLIRRRAAEEALFLGAHHETVMRIAKGEWS